MNPHPLQALVTEAHTALQEGNLEHAKRIIDALQHRGIASDTIATLDAWRKIEELKHIERTVSENPHDPEAWMSLYKIRWELYRNVEATDALVSGLEQDPTHTKMRNRLVSQYHSARAFEAALAQVELGLSVEPSNMAMLDKRAVLLIWLGRNEAKSAIAAAHTIAPTSWCTTYVRYLTIGAIPEAEQLAQQAVEQNPGDPFPLGAVARLELWRGNIDSVLPVATDLIAQQPNRAEGHFLLGAVHALTGNQDGARHLLKSLDCGRCDDGWFEPSAAHVFLSELCHAKMAVAESLGWADKAMSSSERYSPNSHLARQRIMHQTLQNKSGKVDVRWHEVIQNFEPMLHHGPADWAHSLAAYNTMLDSIHSKLGGNRSASPTWLEDGCLEFCPPVDRKAASIRMVQQHIRCHHVDVVLSELMEFVKNHPDDPRAYTYTGEIQLWNGEYAASEVNFNHAIGKEHITVWAWIGLGAARALQGHAGEALQIFSDGIRATNFEGPTVFVYRGEVHRKAGRLDMARLDLDKAIHDKPQRISGWINRVLVDHAMRDEQPAKILGMAIRRTNPSLWWDAAESVGASPLSNADCPTILEGILTLMQGNRSSALVTYLTPDGVLRGARWNREDIPEALMKRYLSPQP